MSYYEQEMSRRNSRIMYEQMYGPGRFPPEDWSDRKLAIRSYNQEQRCQPLIDRDTQIWLGDLLALGVVVASPFAVAFVASRALEAAALKLVTLIPGL